MRLLHVLPVRARVDLGVLTPPSPKFSTITLWLDAVKCHTQYTDCGGEGVFPHCRGAVGEFYRAIYIRNDPFVTQIKNRQTSLKSNGKVKITNPKRKRECWRGHYRIFRRKASVQQKVSWAFLFTLVSIQARSTIEFLTLEKKSKTVVRKLVLKLYSAFETIKCSLSRPCRKTNLNLYIPL